MIQDIPATNPFPAMAVEPFLSHRYPTLTPDLMFQQENPFEKNSKGNKHSGKDKVKGTLTSKKQLYHVVLVSFEFCYCHYDLLHCLDMTVRRNSVLITPDNDW